MDVCMPYSPATQGIDDVDYMIDSQDDHCKND